MTPMYSQLFWLQNWMALCWTELKVLWQCGQQHRTWVVEQRQPGGRTRIAGFSTPDRWIEGRREHSPSRVYKTTLASGLVGISLLLEVMRWLNTQLMQLQAPIHVRTYTKKPSFQKMLFVKLTGVDEQEMAVCLLSSSRLTNGDS